jgi:O-antigen/teichoic acid export membrane protein
LVKTLARDPSQLGAYLFNAVTMKLVLGSLLAAIAIAIAQAAGYPHETLLIIELGCLGMILAALNDILAAVLQAFEQMGRLALWQGIQLYAVGGIAIGLLLTHKGGVVAYALVIAVGAVIPLVANGYYLWPEVRGQMKLDLSLWRAMAVGGMPFFLWGALLLVYGSIDVLMLQGMTNSDVVGWYSLAYRWVGIPVALPMILATVVLPSLATLAHAHGPEFTRIVNRAVQIALFAAIPMAAGIALVANDIIHFLNYPAGFEHSVLLMQILAIHIPVVALDMVLATALTAKDRQKAWLVVGCAAVVVNPTLNLIAIPLTSHNYGNGAIGASMVTVTTEVVMMVGAIYLRPTGVLDRTTISFIVRCVGAALIMVPAVMMTAGLPLGMKIVVGTVTYACAAWALRLFSVRPAWNSLIRITGLFPDRGQTATVPSPAD